MEGPGRGARGSPRGASCGRAGAHARAREHAQAPPARPPNAPHPSQRCRPFLSVPSPTPRFRSQSDANLAPLFPCPPPPFPPSAACYLLLASPLSFVLIIPLDSSTSPSPHHHRAHRPNSRPPTYASLAPSLSPSLPPPLQSSTFPRGSLASSLASFRTTHSPISTHPSESKRPPSQLSIYLHQNTQSSI